MPYQQDSPDRPDYTCNGFAQKFNLSPTTVRGRVSRGEIPSYKVGGARRIPAEYVDSFAGPDTSLDAVVDSIVAAWPKLRAEQLDRIAALLRAGTRISPSTQRRREEQQNRKSIGTPRPRKGSAA